MILGYFWVTNLSRKPKTSKNPVFSMGGIGLEPTTSTMSISCRCRIALFSLVIRNDRSDRNGCLSTLWVTFGLAVQPPQGLEETSVLPVFLVNGDLHTEEFRMDNQVALKHGSEMFAVLVRSCSITHSVDTWLFSDDKAAKLYCNLRWKIPIDLWDSYLVASNPKSSMKINGEPVSYCGWRCSMDETQELHIHLERKIEEF